VPALAQLAVSRALGADDSAYWARRSATGVYVSNPRQGLRARFDAAGVSISSAGGSLDLSLRSISGMAPAAVAPTVRSNRISYARGALSEWYANGPMGLEQGFRIARPLGSDPHRLTLTLALGGSLRARVQPGGAGVALLAPGGKVALRLDQLSASDSSGRSLPVSFALDGGRLSLRVDTAGARYPLNVDPLVQEGQLSASNGAREQGMGSAAPVPLHISRWIVGNDARPFLGAVAPLRTGGMKYAPEWSHLPSPPWSSSRASP